VPDEFDRDAASSGTRRKGSDGADGRRTLRLGIQRFSLFLPASGDYLLPAESLVATATRRYLYVITALRQRSEASVRSSDLRQSVVMRLRRRLFSDDVVAVYIGNERS